MEKLYELHIYTMGTRSYANAVAKEIDPNDDLFKERILSRDESGSNNLPMVTSGVFKSIRYD